MFKGKRGRNRFTGRVLCYLLMLALVMPGVVMTTYAEEPDAIPQEMEQIVPEEVAAPEEGEFEVTITPVTEEEVTEEEKKEEETGAEETKKEETPAEGAIPAAEETPVEETPAEEKPAEEAPVAEDVPVAEEVSKAEEAAPVQTPATEEVKEAVVEEVKAEEETVTAEAKAAVAHKWGIDLDIYVDNANPDMSASSTKGNKTSKSNPKVFNIGGQYGSPFVILQAVLTDGGNRALQGEGHGFQYEWADENLLTARAHMWTSTEEYEFTYTFKSKNTAVVQLQEDFANGIEVIPIAEGETQIDVEGRVVDLTDSSSSAGKSIGSTSFYVKVSKKVSGSTGTSGGVAVTGVKVNKKTAKLDVGKSVTLKASVTPSKASKAVTWSSSNESVATVSAGKVKAVGAGTAVITAMSANGKAGTCTVTVSNPLKKVSFQGGSKATLMVDKNRSETKDVALNIVGGSNYSVAWKSNKRSVADVQGSGANATIIARGKGKATITATVTNSDKKKKTAKFTVTVNAKPTSISVKGVKGSKPVSLNVGKSKSLKAVLEPKGVKGKVKWEAVGNDGVVTVTSSGKIKGAKEGYTQLRVYYVDDPDIQTFVDVRVTGKGKK